jgi:hypothetical protein
LWETFINTYYIMLLLWGIKKGGSYVCYEGSHILELLFQDISDKTQFNLAQLLILNIHFYHLVYNH